MLFETWLTYAIAAFVIIIIPGPTILLVITQSMTYGIKAAIPLVLGVFFGDLIAMLGSMFGLGLLIATSAMLFSIVKFVGALYLIYLGFSLWRAPVGKMGQSTEAIINKVSPWQLGRRSFLVTVLNPKGIIFFLAFLPQFVNPELAMAPQLLILGSTFLVLAVVNAGAYAVMAVRMSQLFQNSSTNRRFNRIGGTALIGAGLITAATQRV
ncbi:MAG: LysE family translocator [Gammaproteobacteria bacterium]|nr:LysE family translocator [Gammaproteobacteria bacterium]